jgi:hypothetical protein
MFCFHCTPHTEVIDIDLISMPFGAYDHPLHMASAKLKNITVFGIDFKIPKEMKLFSYWVFRG